MLGDPSDFDADAAPKINNLATQARIFYYVQRVGVVIDYNKYYAWLEKHPEHRRPMFQPDILGAAPSSVSKRDSRSSLGLSESQVEPNDVSVSDLTDGIERLSTTTSVAGNGKGKGKGKEKEVLAEPGPETDHLDTEPSRPSFKDKDKGKGKEVLPDPDLDLAAPGTESSWLKKSKGKEVLSEPEPGSELESPPDVDLPSWQTAAPRARLYVDRKDAQEPPSPPRDGQSPDEPSYPLRFAEMLRMLQEDIPIPGIRQIPDTIIRDPTAKPFGARVAPRKPWEQAPSEDCSTPSDKIGIEFPPVQESAGQ
jgi:hypothetical protein